MRSFNVCGLTSVLVPAFFAGFAVASAAGSDLAGWIAAAIVGLAVAGYQARSSRSTSCALPPPPATDGTTPRTTDEPTPTRR